MNFILMGDNWKIIRNLANGKYVSAEKGAGGGPPQANEWNERVRRLERQRPEATEQSERAPGNAHIFLIVCDVE